VADMARILEAAARAEEAGTAGQVRELIDLLTGGRIDLEQRGEPAAGRGWLLGRFRGRLTEAITARVAGRAVAGAGGEGPHVEIDFRDDDPPVAPAVVAEIQRLYTDDVLIKEIARRLKMNRNA